MLDFDLDAAGDASATQAGQAQPTDAAGVQTDESASPLADGAAGLVAAATTAPTTTAIRAGRYADSAEPAADGSGPEGWEVKGNEDSMLFHTPESPWYKRTRAEVWFVDVETARAAGFEHWDPDQR